MDTTGSYSFVSITTLKTILKPKGPYQEHKLGTKNLIYGILDFDTQDSIVISFTL